MARDQTRISLPLFFPVPRSILEDRSSPTRDQTWARAVRAPSPNHWPTSKFPSVPLLVPGIQGPGPGSSPLLVSPIPASASGWSLGYVSTILNQAPVQPPPWPGEEAHPGFPVPHSPPLSNSFTGSSLLMLALKLLRSQLGAFEATLLTFPPVTDSWEMHPTLEFSRPYLSSWFPALRSLFVPPPPGSRH